MIVLSGADLVLPDRILSPGTLVIDGGRIVEIRPGARASVFPRSPFTITTSSPGSSTSTFTASTAVDALDEGERDCGDRHAAAALRRRPRSVRPPSRAAPARCAGRWTQVRMLREATPGRGRAGPAGASRKQLHQPGLSRGAAVAACAVCRSSALVGDRVRSDRDGRGDFSADDILREIERAAPDVGIVTLAPELDGGLDLSRWLVGARPSRVARPLAQRRYDEALEAIAAGARQATHLFNRMPPFEHRAPGLVGAILQTRGSGGGAHL